MAGERTERTVLALGTLLVVALIGLIATGFFLKWFYRPTEAHAWTDIQTLHTSIATGLLTRNAHRWFAWVIAIGMPIYTIIFLSAGLGNDMIVKRRGRTAAIALMVLGLVGLSIVMTSMKTRVSLRPWYLVHETPAYILVPTLAAALLARPRARRSQPPTHEPPAP